MTVPRSADAARPSSRLRCGHSCAQRWGLAKVAQWERGGGSTGAQGGIQVSSAPPTPTAHRSAADLCPKLELQPQQPQELGRLQVTRGRSVVQMAITKNEGITWPGWPRMSHFKMSRLPPPRDHRAPDSSLMNKHSKLLCVG